MVKAWGITFDGSKLASIEEFISRMEGKARKSALSFNEMVPVLPRCFTGCAKNWCALEKDKWTSWNKFCEEARFMYGTSQRYQQRLAMEIISRTQGRDEPVQDYITNLRSHMAKIIPAKEDPKVKREEDYTGRKLEFRCYKCDGKFHSAKICPYKNRRASRRNSPTQETKILPRISVPRTSSSVPENSVCSDETSIRTDESHTEQTQNDKDSTSDGSLSSINRHPSKYSRRSRKKYKKRENKKNEENLENVKAMTDPPIDVVNSPAGEVVNKIRKGPRDRPRLEI